METFSTLLALYEGNPAVTVFPHKGHWCGAFIFSLICAWTNDWFKQSRHRWFETPSGSLWYQRNEAYVRFSWDSVITLISSNHRNSMKWAKRYLSCCDVFVQKYHCDRFIRKSHLYSNKANLRDLIAATGLVILLKSDPYHRIFCPCDFKIWMKSS